jgi:hypothetical protein
MSRRDARSAVDEVAAECKAFLVGRYLRSLRDRGHPIPAWGWTNPLAHASEEQLRTMISTPGDAGGPAGGWPRACCYLAGVLLDLAQRRGSLTELQVTALVPFELDLISRQDVAWWMPGT